jgi:membrane protease YdiL (CAAX protease family)
MTSNKKIENKNIENNTNSITEENKKSMENLKTQEDEEVVIDIPNQKNEIEISKPKKKKKHVNFFKQFLIPRVYYTAIVVYILSVLTNIFILGLLHLNDEDGDSLNTEGVKADLDKTNFGFLLVLYIILIGPLIEELICRLLLFRGISIIGEKIGKNNKFIRRFIKLLAYIISSAFFAFGHFHFSFKVLLSDIVNFPSYFIMGIYLALAYDYDGYFLAALLTHILNNSVAILIMFLFGTDV